MPERDTFDLDAAFRGLERDIAGLTTSRGAGRAMAVARRRRRTRLTAVVAAVTVLALGGVAVGRGSHGQSTGPSGSLPEPAPLTARALSGATDGWVSGWSAQTAEQAHLPKTRVERCLGRAPSSSTTPGAVVTRGSGNLFFTAGHAFALATLAGFSGDAVARRVWTSMVGTLATCPGARPARQLTWGAASVLSFDVASAHGRADHLWVARVGTTAGLMWVTGASSEITVAADDGVARALVAALEFPESMRAVNPADSGPGSTSSGSSGPVTAPQVSPDAFARAVSGWDTAWSTSGSDKSVTEVPCGSGFPGSGGGSVGEALGANGDQEFATFGTLRDANAEMARLRQALSACAGYTVSDDSGLLVAVGPDVLWALQAGSQIAVITVPGSGAPPPASVSASVEALIRQALETGGGPAESGAPATSTGP